MPPQSTLGSALAKNPTAGGKPLRNTAEASRIPMAQGQMGQQLANMSQPMDPRMAMQNAAMQASMQQQLQAMPQNPNFNAAIQGFSQGAQLGANLPFEYYRQAQMPGGFAGGQIPGGFASGGVRGGIIGPDKGGDGIAYAGGNPNFDESTGRFINQPAQGQIPYRSDLRDMTPQQQQQVQQGIRDLNRDIRQQEMQNLTRLSPGVYRNQAGDLVNRRGGMLPNQPDRNRAMNQVQNIAQQWNSGGYGNYQPREENFMPLIQGPGGAINAPYMFPQGQIPGRFKR